MVEWRKRHNGELNDLNSSSNIVQLIKFRRMRCAGYIARWGKVEVYKGFWWENLRKSDHLQNPGVDGRIVFRWIFRNWDVRAWAVSMSFRIKTGGLHR